MKEKRESTNMANLICYKQKYWCVGGNKKEESKDADVMDCCAKRNGKLEAEMMQFSATSIDKFYFLYTLKKEMPIFFFLGKPISVPGNGDM